MAKNAFVAACELLLLVVPLAVLGCFPCQAQSKHSRQTEKADPPPKLTVGVEYDARDFLSAEDVVLFNGIYPEFGEELTKKNWKWVDVDPLGLFSESQDRALRRQEFILALSPEDMGPNEPVATDEQKAFRLVLCKQFNQDPCMVVVGGSTIKWGGPYSPEYDKPIPGFLKALLGRTASVGLQWALLGGRTFYMYNGTILMARYSNGWVSAYDLDIDRPAIRERAQRHRNAIPAEGDQSDGRNR